MQPQVTALEVSKLTKKLDSSEKENEKFFLEIENLKRSNESLKSKMAV